MGERIPTTERLAHEAPLAERHEHNRLYDALLAAEHYADLAGHGTLERVLREARHEVGRELAEGCDLRLSAGEVRFLARWTIRELEEDLDRPDNPPPGLPRHKPNDYGPELVARAPE